MTPELTYLALTLILAIVQIFLPAIGRTVQYGTEWNAGPRDAIMPPVKPITGRLERAQANLYETLPLFIAAVLIAHVSGEDGFLTYWGATLYFWGRVVFVPIYAFGIPALRSVVFITSLVGLVMIIAALFL
ncbi:MAPEG family protein [Brevundimonas sp.]|uniref:MAPEG family protein n=1 Tax=Brevundimonas sp. TaxID=1871086 RepID=UPI001A28DC93|nr:MAPEG family protein [Brevundimonas sp.]MBJ7484729.1 MAPEG family protein [Brevundimonas sp.]